jgi:hypothetical protein
MLIDVSLLQLAFTRANEPPVIPWYHYVPVKVDYVSPQAPFIRAKLISSSRTFMIVRWKLFVTALLTSLSVMAFFVGTPDGRGNHDRIANRLAENGRHWAGRYVSPSSAKRCELTSLQWRRNDMASYMYRLILEWARIIHDGGEVDYVP